MTDFPEAVTDTVGTSDSLVVTTHGPYLFTDTVGTSDTLTVGIHVHVGLTDTVGTSDSDVNTVFIQTNVFDTCGTSDAAGVVLTFTQSDTWRPRVKPDKTVFICCKTPVGDHNSPVGFAAMRLFLYETDGTGRIMAKGVPSLESWDSYGHPEWAPDGTKLVIWAETASQWKLVLLNDVTFDIASVPRTVTKPDSMTDPIYSPSGGSLLFVNQSGGTYAIATCTTAGASYTELITSSNPLASPAYSSDGSKIVYTERLAAPGGPYTYGHYALKYASSTGSGQMVLYSTGAPLHPCWADTDTVAFQLYRDGIDTVFKLARIDLDAGGFEILGTGEYPQAVHV